METMVDCLWKGYQRSAISGQQSSDGHEIMIPACYSLQGIVMSSFAIEDS